MVFTEVAPGVVSAEHRVVEGKNGIVFGAQRALAIDAGMFPEEGDATAGFIRERGYEPGLLVLTHGHGDHALGSGAFRAAVVVAQVGTAGVMRRQLPGWAERAGRSEHEMEATLAWPVVTFAGEVSLDLGGKRVRLFGTPGHSPDSVCAYVEADRVLFGGDTAVTGIVPAISDGDGRQLEATLRRLATLEVETLVGGHGPVLHGAERVRDWLMWLAGYLAGMRDVVRRGLGQGRTPEALLETVGYDAFVGDRLPADRHGMRQRHRNTVQKIIQEEIGEG